MERYLEMTGKNEEAAIAAALAQLGLDRDEVSVEILERAKSGFLGIGNSPAKVRVTYESADSDETTETIVAGTKDTGTAKQAEPKEAKKHTGTEERTKRTETAAPRAESRPARSSRRRDDDEIAPFDPACAADITNFLTGLLAHMELSATPDVTYSERGVYEVMIDGEQLGALIGRRGETLDAIQQLTGYAVNRGRSRRVRVHVDAEGYRQKREQALEALALRVAEKAIKQRRDVHMDPMNAYERHVVHTALQDVPGVSTHSVGSEPARRVVVSIQR